MRPLETPSQGISINLALQGLCTIATTAATPLPRREAPLAPQPDVRPAQKGSRGNRPKAPRGGTVPRLSPNLPSQGSAVDKRQRDQTDADRNRGPKLATLTRQMVQFASVLVQAQDLC